VRIGLVLKLGIQLFGVFNIRHIPHTLARQALFALLVGDMIFSSYILFWLFTKEAKDYFRFPRADWSTDQQGKVVP